LVSSSNFTAFSSLSQISYSSITFFTFIVLFFFCFFFFFFSSCFSSCFSPSFSFSSSSFFVFIILASASTVYYTLLDISSSSSLLFSSQFQDCDKQAMVFLISLSLFKKPFTFLIYTYIGFLIFYNLNPCFWANSKLVTNSIVLLSKNTSTITSSYTLILFKPIFTIISLSMFPLSRLQ